MAEKFKPKKLRLPKSILVECIIIGILRLETKALISWGFATAFRQIGVYGGFWMKALIWITSYWISCHLFKFIGGLMSSEDDVRGPLKLRDTVITSELGGIIRDVKRLINYDKATEEDPS